MEKEKLFCKGGGCTAKLGAGILSRVLEHLPRGPEDVNLLVGYDSKDDAAVYKVSDDIAFVQTLDFFPPMVDDPYTFGKIAATNALSDIYAMGGEVKTALNIVCFPEKMDLNILGEIMRGGAEKVIEAGGTLAGGHSIADSDIKYGLSVTGLVNPNKIYTNNGAKPGDALILTKRLGVGIICTANRVGEASSEVMEAVTDSMTTLNKYAAECCRNFEIHACTDVTGFSFLGHLHEMMDGQLSCHIHSKQVPVFEEALRHADEFLLTAALPQKSVLYIPESCHPSVFPLLMPPLSGHAAVPASDRFPPGSCPEGRFALFPPASVLLRWLLSVLFSPAAALLPPAFSVPVHPAVFWQSPLAPLRKDKPALFWQAYTDYNWCIHCV